MTSPEIELNHLSLVSYVRKIDLLAKWKVIPLGSLHNILPKKIHKTYSYRLADQLVKAGVAQKIKCIGSNLQVLIPTKGALIYSYQNFNFPKFGDYCRDAFIASALIELPVFRNKVIGFRHEGIEENHCKSSLSADFTIDGVDSKSTVLHMGVFFEPPYHSRLNSHERMLRYVDKGNFNVIILIFKSLDDLHKYRIFYFESRDHKFGKDLKEYICLVHMEEYFSHPCKINKSFVYFQNEETTLQDLFK